MDVHQSRTLRRNLGTELRKSEFDIESPGIKSEDFEKMDLQMRKVMTLE